MNRSYYSNDIISFKNEDSSFILEKLKSSNLSRTLEDQQIFAWEEQVEILQDVLSDFNEGKLFFEFSIPRMGKRVDNILIIKDCLFVIEFKVGSKFYDSNAVNQVVDYALDLLNFHEGTHNLCPIPILVSTESKETEILFDEVLKLKTCIKTNAENLKSVINQFLEINNYESIDIKRWENSLYKPTPTIIEASRALYKGHNVHEISRSDAGAVNLSKTNYEISRIISTSKKNNYKSICFITGVPGAGKTLAGLNIANESSKSNDDNVVFLSGNGPLVDVLREALVRDSVRSNGIRRGESESRVKRFIQNVHHFRDEYIQDTSSPSEKVVIFDEAQRAWEKKKTANFMKKRGIRGFDKSEPSFLIDVMDRHKDWCVIVCLIGGGQEINTGEAGLQEWIDSIRVKSNEWKINISEKIISDDTYIKDNSIREWLNNNCNSFPNLHLSTSIRSFRSEELSNFIKCLLDNQISQAKNIYSEIKTKYPICVTRDLNNARAWIRSQSRGTERMGMIASSGARRLKAHGLDVKNEIKQTDWFLNEKDDVRSSYFLESIATQFDIQGLEIDWSLMCWGGDFFYGDKEWNYQRFHGSRWLKVKNISDREFIKNAYRVLLTRARQGIVIFIPYGSSTDDTRKCDYYDGTFKFLKLLGIKEI